MSNFPKLIPAFTCFIVLLPRHSLGTVSRSASALTLAPFAPSAGSLKSEPGYPLSVDAVFVHGADYIRQDGGASSTHVRLDVHSLLKDQKSGALIKFDYEGVIALSKETAAAMGGAEGAGTTGWGDAFTHIKFETGSEELRALEQKVFVASGRFVVEEGKPLVVEYKISEVTA